jgi:hypothetical protein
MPVVIKTFRFGWKGFTYFFNQYVPIVSNMFRNKRCGKRGSDIFSLGHIMKNLHNFLKGFFNRNTEMIV